jgi:hypothetical protein
MRNGGEIANDQSLDFSSTQRQRRLTVRDKAHEDDSGDVGDEGDIDTQYTGGLLEAPVGQPPLPVTYHLLSLGIGLIFPSRSWHQSSIRSTPWVGRLAGGLLEAPAGRPTFSITGGRERRAATISHWASLVSRNQQVSKRMLTTAELKPSRRLCVSRSLLHSWLAGQRGLLEASAGQPPYKNLQRSSPFVSTKRHLERTRHYSFWPSTSSDVLL